MRPTGSVTLLFTDIEGSTQRWERFPGTMGDAVRRHDTLVREAIESNGGYVFKTIGDAFCAAFSSVGDALRAALSLQRALQSEDFCAVDGIRVRLALHSGVCEERDADYFGPTVNRVARLLSIGHGGQMLLSAAVAELAAGCLPPEASLNDLGLHQLKDLAMPERVCALYAPGLSSDFPPLRSLSTMSNNLPHYLTEIFGREREIAELESLIEKAQLVTIVGPGGIGKTRLCVQAAADLIDVNHDGAWFVDLAPLVDPALVATTIAKAVNVDLRGAADLRAALTTTLNRSHMLIVLDNCEHVIMEAALVAESIVLRCPHVRIVATSREPLGVAGEALYRLDTLDAAPSSALFVARARLSDRQFACQPEDIAIVESICRRLDGIPLAIELAAARARVMPLNLLAARLNERFQLLTGGSRTALPRQQTLRALIDWSYELIDDTEKRVFQKLSTFYGSFSLEAACDVAGDDRTESWGVIDALSALVDKSLVVLAGSDRPRYRMLESIREYALMRLRETPEEEATRRAHATFFTGVSEDVAQRLGFDAEAEWLERFEPENDNFRGALDWAVTADHIIAAKIVANLPDFWYHSNQIAEGLSRSESALATLQGDEAEDDRNGVLLAIGALAIAAGHFHRSLEASELALESAERRGDRRSAATASLYVGLARTYLGKPERRVQRLRAAVETHRAAQQPLRALLAAINYASIFSESDPHLARATLEEALPDARVSGWPHTAMRIETMLAELEFQNGDVSSATDLAARVVASTRPRNTPFALGIALVNLCSYSSVAGDYESAERAGREAATIFRELGHQALVALALQGLAVPLAAGGDVRAAAQLLGHVDALFNVAGYQRERTEEIVHCRLLELISKRLDETSLREELAAGRLRSTEEACALAQLQS